MLRYCTAWHVAVLYYMACCGDMVRYTRKCTVPKDRCLMPLGLHACRVWYDMLLISKGCLPLSPSRPRSTSGCHRWLRPPHAPQVAARPPRPTGGCAPPTHTRTTGVESEMFVPRSFMFCWISSSSSVMRCSSLLRSLMDSVFWLYASCGPTGARVQGYTTPAGQGPGGRVQGLRSCRPGARGEGAGFRAYAPAGKGTKGRV